MLTNCAYQIINGKYCIANSICHDDSNDNASSCLLFFFDVMIDLPTFVCKNCLLFIV